MDLGESPDDTGWKRARRRLSPTRWRNEGKWKGLQGFIREIDTFEVVEEEEEEAEPAWSDRSVVEGMDTREAESGATGKGGK